MSGETITRLRATTVVAGRMGSDRPNWDGPVDDLEIPGWLITPKGSTEDNTDRTAVADLIELFGPSDADVRAADRLTVRGEPWEVEGDPDVWTDPDDRSLDSTVVTARRVTG